MRWLIGTVSAITAFAVVTALPSLAAAADDEPPYASPASEDGVRVELHADAPDVRLYQMSDGDADVACAAPCGRVLPRDGVYVIAGPGVRRTSPFTLSGGDADHVTLDVRAGSRTRYEVGVGMTGLGVVAFLGGGTSFLLVATRDLARADDGPRDPWLNRLLVVTGAGVPLVLAGMILIFTSPTHVTTSSGVTFSLGAPAGRPHAWKVALTPRGLEF